MKNNAPEHVVIAGLLHDVVEDEDVTLSDIRDEFGDKMATLLDVTSEPEELIHADGGKSKTWPERKAHTIEFIKNAGRDMKLLSCADKLANLRDIIRDYDRRALLSPNNHQHPISNHPNHQQHPKPHRNNPLYRFTPSASSPSLAHPIPIMEAVTISPSETGIPITDAE